jgi:hypothetical protein
MLRSKRAEEAFAFATGIHAIDLLVMLGEEVFGGARQASGVLLETQAGHTIHQLDIVCQNGATARCEIIPNAGVHDESYAIFGDNVCVSITMPWWSKESRAELWRDGELVDSVTWPAEISEQSSHGDCTEHDISRNYELR